MYLFLLIHFRLQPALFGNNFVTRKQGSEGKNLKLTVPWISPLNKEESIITDNARDFCSYNIAVLKSFQGEDRLLFRAESLEKTMI